MPFQHSTDSSTTTASSVASLSTTTARPSVGILSIAKPVATAATQPPKETVESVSVTDQIDGMNSNSVIIPAVQTGRNLVANGAVTRVSTSIFTRQ